MPKTRHPHWRGDAAETWLQFPQLACDDPRFSGLFDVVVVNYTTYMWRRNLNVTSIANWMREKLRPLTNERRYSQSFIIAHSMGGLIARQLALFKRLTGETDQFIYLIEVGSPHGGGNHAALAAELHVTPQLTEDVAADSSFLQTLAAQWQALPYDSRPRTQCYSSPGDAIVPEFSALNPCDQGLSHPIRWGHRELVKPPDTIDGRYSMPMAIVAAAMELRAPHTER